MHKCLVWDVERARPVATGLFYAQALLIADTKETALRRPFIVMEA